ncbi:tryptophan 2,3-dioxygenase family protein [Solitalea canadensis]|uniref:Tryptophan 2,3-dioxygenase (Vermilion) n=1 Tax=Solitalea canadensis (strain ATCC 29591 / DSM 3403 / JCM 21819 / LMG 8368 / NBRC 15130 / NCIMB 12057 / USAM 9D) TaxID=929556 RepID=H8KMY6_SOLCM|nr:tryptophan 2,3-dioxygenase family protein [Solitalea canadensis]AFD09065.1 tryptophan 2,3-dioxygenase (vermilion) [Solitalea canadensis DSM 3403]
MELSEDLLTRLKQLQQKYDAMGQDMNSYLDGLLYADFLTYWDYIHLDTLLTLQRPKTQFPDEKIFIMYHQITELYLNLILHECEQIAHKENLTATFFEARLKRINRYFETLIDSFDVMVDGMEKEQFLAFRMSLLPASGFQSGQYRMIEIYASDFLTLVPPEKRDALKGESASAIFENLYWKTGATELSTGKKTLTLKQFEEKYSKQFISLAETLKEKNFWQQYLALKSKGENVSSLEQLLRSFDIHVNVNWKLMHYRSAVRYMQRDPEDIKATGGTNWQKYLPPRFQKLVFYPELWTQEEVDEWGKKWVDENVQPREM